MAMRVTTDHDEITAVLDALVTRDPVGCTILGTIMQGLSADAWMARDGAALAVTSNPRYPLVLAGDWTDAQIADLIDVLPMSIATGFSGPIATVEAAVERWGRPVAHRMGQRLFSLDELTEPTGVAGRAAVAGDEHRELVRRWVEEFMQEADAFGRGDTQFADMAVDGGWCRLWLDAAGDPVSMAVRRPVIGGSARVGPVYTPPQQRGHGYGSAATAAATRSILDDGAVPVLFTDLANPTSNKIYQQLGYRPVEDRVVVAFA